MLSHMYTQCSTKDFNLKGKIQKEEYWWDLEAFSICLFTSAEPLLREA